MLNAPDPPASEPAKPASAIGAGGGPADLPLSSPGQLAQALAQHCSEQDLALLRWQYDCEHAARAEGELRRRDLPDHLDPNDLAQTGWGVIFARDADPAVEHYLGKLLTRRQQQAGSLYKRLIYEPGDTGRYFLTHRNQVSPGVIRPKQMPYYLLIVGSPEAIPFSFQFELAVNYAVGRIHFNRPQDYELYAKAVLAAESRGVNLPRRAAFFAVENDDDPTTQRMAQAMVEPLARTLPTYPHGWEIEVWGKDRAQKKDLAQLLGGQETPGLLLTSCHGNRFSAGHQDQEAFQGALLCQDWPGPQVSRDTHAGHFFHAGDLQGDRISGLIAFFFACYSAGTPIEDDFPHEGTNLPADQSLLTPARVIAPQPFVARLPQELLRRGALAVVGHIDRGWTLTFSWTLYGRHVEAIASLEDTLAQLLRGRRLGHALRPLQRRTNAIAAQLAVPLEHARKGILPPQELLGFLWTAHHDARNLVLLGDPAVQLHGGHGFTRKPRRQGPLFLDADLLAFAQAQARQAGISLGQWVGRLIAGQQKTE